MGPNKGISLKSVLIPKLLNNTLALCSSINFDFLLSHIAHFGKSIVLPFFTLTTLDLYFLYFFYTSDSTITLLLKKD